MKHQEYVVAFIFNEAVDKVWLIRKNKPEWQKNCLNGIGGKIEEGETPMIAMIRELKEESGITLTDEELVPVGEMQGTNNDGSSFKVYVFGATTDQILKSQEEEQIDWYLLHFHKTHRHIENVPMLIQACIYKLRGSSNFSYLIMQY